LNINIQIIGGSNMKKLILTALISFGIGGLALGEAGYQQIKELQAEKAMYQQDLSKTTNTLNKTYNELSDTKIELAKTSGNLSKANADLAQAKKDIENAKIKQQQTQTVADKLANELEQAKRKK
jgi:septal ring factor EnvC (AmiA/AmiB activator)